MFNQVARRVIDDLVDFSGETSVDGYMKIFKAQQIAEKCHFVIRMREEAQNSRNLIEEEIEMKEEEMELMNALGTSLAPLDQPWDAIVGLGLSLKEGDKERLDDECWKLEELECKVEGFLGCLCVWLSRPLSRSYSHYRHRNHDCCGCLESVVGMSQEALVAIDGIGDNIVIIHGRAKKMVSMVSEEALAEAGLVLIILFRSIRERVRKIHDFTMESAVIHSLVGGSNVDVDLSMCFSTLTLLQCPLKK
ncbi:hypothetical protein Tco_0554229 [Tanacetum coccineum]